MYPNLKKVSSYDGRIWELAKGREGQGEYFCGRQAEVQDFGTTATVAIVKLHDHTLSDIIVANTGDSVAYLGKESGALVGEGITVLHNAMVCDIVACLTPKNEDEVDRVSRHLLITDGYFSVNPNYSYYCWYGLAMSRALGHKFFSRFGIVPDPAVNFMKPSSNARYLVLTSDGVSDVLDTQEIFDFITTKSKEANFDLDLLASALLEESTAAWRRKYPQPQRAAEITDNMTVIVVDLLRLTK